MEVSLAGKVAIITGAASGIGLAVVQAYLACGAAGIVAVDRKTELPPALTAALIEHKSRLIYVCGDVAAEKTAIDCVGVAVASFGRVDIFVGNAAVSVVKPLHLHSPEEWDTVMNVNVKGLYWAVRHLIPVMIAQKNGLLLLTGSISGVAGIPEQGAYAASKGALHQMTRQMAIDYARHNIRVNSIACGTIDTPIVHQSAEASGNPEAFWAMLRGGHPIGRIGSAQEVAAFFAFMASDLATFFTGSVLMLDGGYTAQ